MMTFRKAIVAVAVLTATYSPAGRAWFWDTEKNTVKAYEDCLKRNASVVTPIGDIEIACAKKTAAPIPLDKVTIQYTVDQHRSMFPDRETMNYPLWHR